MNLTPEYPGQRETVYMQKAFAMAQEAYNVEEVPVGAVIVYQGKIIAKAHNQVEGLKDPTAHAEMIAITQASSYLNSKVLSGTRMYVTLEPCPMCAMAIVLAKIDTLVYATADPRTGACGSIMNITSNPALNHTVEVFSGILQEESSALLKEFFQNRR